MTASGPYREEPAFGAVPCGGDPGRWLKRILILTALVFSPSLGGDFLLDQREGIVHNRFLADWSFAVKSLIHDESWFSNPSQLPGSPYYRPLVNVWLAINFHIFGLHPAGWHVAMIALHLLVVWLVFRVAGLLTADRWTALFAAALFALLPIHAGAVVFAFGPSLCAAFAFGAFEFFLRGRSSKRWREPAISIALFAAAMLSYEAAAAFPILIATHVFLLERGEPVESIPSQSFCDWISKRAGSALAAALPYALEVAAYIFLRRLALGFTTRPLPSAAQTPNLLAAILTLPEAILTYLAILIVPWRPDVAHNLTAIRTVASPGFYLPAIGVAALAAAMWLLLAHRSRRNLYLFCAAWFLITLAPVLDLNLMVAGVAIQDRYLYIPSFGICLMIADPAVEFARRSAKNARTAKIASTLVIVIFAVSLIRAERFWRNDAAWYSRCVEDIPNSAACHRGLGMALVADGEYVRARPELKRAISLAPGDAGDLYNLALVDDRLGDSRAGESAFAQWLSSVNRPTPEDYTRLAMFADAAGDAAGTESALNHAAALPGGVAAAAIARAQMKFNHGDRGAAEAELRNFLQKNPGDAQALGALAGELSDERRYADALPLIRRALQAAPSDPNLYYQAALVLHKLGRDRAARLECAAAMTAAPYDPNVRRLMDAIDAGGAK
ncbi:MAG: tetratricopeptide repeat protein [Candidatus Binataceae bacterium]